MSFIRNLFSPAAPPEQPAAATPPTINSAEVQAARRRTRIAALQRKGRSKTLLGEPLGDRASGNIVAPQATSTLGGS